MPAQYIYQHAQGSNVDLSGQVRAYTQEVSMNAEEGSVAISSITVDDQAGGLDIIGHHKFLIRETSEASNSKTILYGLIADRDVSRGPFKIANSRQWTVNMSDVNALLGRGIMRGADANRPAETDVQRIQWLMTTGEMNLILDTTYINTSATTTAMDAVDYRDQTVLSIIDDCAQASGKNYWVIVMNEDPNPRLGLWYDFATSTAYTSTVRLTNVLADVDSSTTFAVFNDDLKLNRDPSRVYSSVLLPYDGGEVFVTDDSIRLQFSRRDTTAPSINVKSSAKATARALRYLHDIATEEDRLTMSYLVPLAKVNRLMHGHRFEVKFSHLPGYEDWTFVRALKRTVKAESEEFYRVTIEATPISGGGSCSTALASASSYKTGTTVITCTNHASGPIGAAISLAPSSPSAIIAVLGAALCSFDPGGFNAASAPYTWHGPTASDLGGSGYRGNVTGSAGTFQLSFTSGDANVIAVAAAAIATSASAPVQTGEQLSSGNTVTLSSTPTVGNILVTASYNLGSGVVPLTGWTTLVADQTMSDGDGVHGIALQIAAKCVEASDTKVIPVPSSARLHSSFVTEWQIT